MFHIKTENCLNFELKLDKMFKYFWPFFKVSKTCNQHLARYWKEKKPGSDCEGKICWKVTKDEWYQTFFLETVGQMYQTLHSWLFFAGKASWVITLVRNDARVHFPTFQIEFLRRRARFLLTACLKKLSNGPRNLLRIKIDSDFETCLKRERKKALYSYCERGIERGEKTWFAPSQRWNVVNSNMYFYDGRKRGTVRNPELDTGPYPFARDTEYTISWPF